MGTSEPDKDTRDVLKRLEKLGWTYVPLDPKKSHTVGHANCGESGRERCHLPVFGTPGGNQPAAIWRLARRCTHGFRPQDTFKRR